MERPSMLLVLGALGGLGRCVSERPGMLLGANWELLLGALGELGKPQHEAPGDSAGCWYWEHWGNWGNALQSVTGCCWALTGSCYWENWERQHRALGDAAGP